MPTITISKKDLDKLLGTTLSREQLSELLEYAKAEIEKEENDELTIALNDTNQPYLWSTEGLSLLLKGLLNKETGLPPLILKKTEGSIIVDKTVKTIRPHIAAFAAHGPPLTEHQLKQLIQLQEKLAENYGRHRQTVSIGLYPSDKISYPLTYKAVKPETTRFTPLDFDEETDLTHILTDHPKGKQYAWILEKATHYPLLIDAKNTILSFPPIINSEHAGKLTTGTKNILFEATGTDEHAVNLTCTIAAYALSIRGYTIHPISIHEGTKQQTTPHTNPQHVPLNKNLITKRLGLKLTEKEITRHLKRFRYNYDGKKVTIPPYRCDIMHQYDIIEDIGISYGYNNIPPATIHTHTRGQALPETTLINNIRNLCVGMNCQETMSPILTNKELLYTKMNCSTEQTVDIDNYTTQTYSSLRTWILPTLLNILSQNKHTEAPYNIFEEGLVTIRQGTECKDQHHIALLKSHTNTTFTEIRQAAEHVLNQLGQPFTIIPLDHPSFIPGRCAAAINGKKQLALFGEIHPQVLQNFGLDLPTIGMEINMNELF